MDEQDNESHDSVNDASSDNESDDIIDLTDTSSAPSSTGKTYYQQKISNRFIACDNCHVCFATDASYEKHIKLCSLYNCVICKKTFHSKETYDKHFRNCPPIRFPCTICSKTYSRKVDAERHIKKHVPVQKTFVCHWCACQCLTGRQLNLHIEQNHPMS